MARVRREAEPGPSEPGVVCHLGALLEARHMTLTRLAEVTGITVANLSVLKNDRARAVRFSTLTAVCQALECQPGDLLTVATPGARTAAVEGELVPAAVTSTQTVTSR